MIVTIIELMILIPTIITPTIFVVNASDETAAWSITFQFTETNGASNSVIFGEKPDALDTLDQYDLPEPPAPPQIPYIRSWFETSFKVPFNNLLQEFKSSSSNMAVWNLSLIWFAAPDNLSNTTINILWDSSLVNSNHTQSLLLYENDVNVANMVTDNSHSFSTNGSLRRFQIIYQIETSKESEKPTELPILPFVLSGVVCIVIITTAIFFVKRKKN